ncbi:hypothetical protein Spea_1624 [Shewanella pealeana ATCC 700345]|uniref:Uncharacterized protein n=2 Tax=Shewanella pealeana TaxID=70864 RepID=A8H312_SHEPA|nr:hypothetical protein Spea_1624 [Shewanella pealeana ATCC 700345]
MLATLSHRGIRLDKLMLFHLLLVTSWLLIIAPFFHSTVNQVPVLLSSALVPLTCISILFGLKLGHGFNKKSYSFLFASWMLVWLTQLI